VLGIEIADEAARFLQELPAKYARQVDRRIRGLAVEPFPATTKKLWGMPDVHRVRQVPWRIFYPVFRSAGLLIIEAIGDRKDIYRR
jgi:mRNA-degrading endonuclease RelE of RelBE toxin-antitoxin system